MPTFSRNINGNNLYITKTDGWSTEYGVTGQGYYEGHKYTGNALYSGGISATSIGEYKYIQLNRISAGYTSSEITLRVVAPFSATFSISGGAGLKTIYLTNEQALAILNASNLQFDIDESVGSSYSRNYVKFNSIDINIDYSTEAVLQGTLTNMQVNPILTADGSEVSFYNASLLYFPTNYAKVTWSNYPSWDSSNISYYQTAVERGNGWEYENVPNTSLSNWWTLPLGNNGPFKFAARAIGIDGQATSWTYVDAVEGSQITSTDTAYAFYKNLSPTFDSFTIEQNNIVLSDDKISLAYDTSIVCSASDLRGGLSSGPSDNGSRIYYQYFVNNSIISTWLSTNSNYTYTSKSLQELSTTASTVQFKTQITDGQYTLEKSSNIYKIGQTITVTHMSWLDNDSGGVLSMSGVTLDGTYPSIRCQVVYDSKTIYNAIRTNNNGSISTPNLRSRYIAQFGNTEVDDSYYTVILTAGGATWSSEISTSFTPISAELSIFNADIPQYYFKQGEQLNDSPILYDQVNASLSLSDIFTDLNIPVKKIINSKETDTGIILTSTQSNIPLSNLGINDDSDFKLKEYVQVKVNNRFYDVTNAESNSLNKTQLQEFGVTGSINQSIFTNDFQGVKANISFYSTRFNYNWYCTKVIIKNLGINDIVADFSANPQLITVSTNPNILSVIASASAIDNETTLTRTWVIPSINVNGSIYDVTNSTESIELNTTKNITIEIPLTIALYDSAGNSISFASYPKEFDPVKSLIITKQTNTISPPTAPSFTSISRVSQ